MSKSQTITETCPPEELYHHLGIILREGRIHRGVGTVYLYIKGMRYCVSRSKDCIHYLCK